MKPIKFTKADERRAHKMGWYLAQTMRICALASAKRFKTDAEAAEWVVDHANLIAQGLLSVRTCRKAVLLCCGGGR